MHVFIAIFSLSYVFFFLRFYLFERERARKHMQEWGERAEREGEADSAEQGA